MLLVIHYDNKNQGFSRLTFTKKSLLTDSIYISADYAIISQMYLLMIAEPAEIYIESDSSVFCDI
jgi:hypothetical protein